MNSKQSSPQERIAVSFKQLTVTASDLNSASDELSEVVSLINQALKELNLGIAGWAVVGRGGGGDQDPLYYWRRELGYAKIGSEWGIALRETFGHEDREDEDSNVWLFCDAPRWMRIEVVSKIPDLLEHL